MLFMVIESFREGRAPDIYRCGRGGRHRAAALSVARRARRR